MCSELNFFNIVSDLLGLEFEANLKIEIVG